MENVVVAAGHNMLGLSLAPVTGKMVAAMLLGEKPPVDPAPYRLDRFRWRRR
jgi:D-amino-acid dehydrogenase